MTAPSQPDAGNVVVPVDADWEMMKAGVEAAMSAAPDIDGNVGFVQVRAAWDAMIAKGRRTPADAGEGGAEAIKRAETYIGACERTGNGGTKAAVIMRDLIAALRAPPAPDCGGLTYIKAEVHKGTDQ